MPEIDELAALRIAEEYVAQIGTLSGISWRISEQQAIERSFGWVFFYLPEDEHVLVGGNAPIIVNRKDGSVHSTGTAYPIEQYLESYARVGRAFPFATPEHLCVLSGGDPQLSAVRIARAIRSATGMSLTDAKSHADELTAGRPTTLSFASAQRADDFHAEIQNFGLHSVRDTRYC